MLLHRGDENVPILRISSYAVKTLKDISAIIKHFLNNIFILDNCLTICVSMDTIHIHFSIIQDNEFFFWVMNKNVCESTDTVIAYIIYHSIT